MAAWLALAALFVAILAIPAAAIATRRWGNRRARLDLETGATPLLPGGVQSGLLEMTYRDVLVPDPHLVSVALRNSGPRDLASGMFDRGRPITVKFDQTFYGLTAATGGIEAVSPAIGTPAADAVISVRPGLLKRGASWTFSAVTTGPVEVSVDAPLIDTDVRAIAPAKEGRAEITLRLSVLGITAELPLRRGS